LKNLKAIRLLEKTKSRGKSAKWSTSFTYTIYNVCLQGGCFPKRWRKAKIFPIDKPGKEKLQDASKYRIMSLINVGGKVLEKLLINRVMHHLYSNNLMNTNQNGLTPKRASHLPH